MVMRPYILMLVIIFSQACSPQNSQETLKPIQLSYRWLWDPASPDLDDWQLLGSSPRDLIAGEDGELFVSDRQNARVIHFTTNGGLIGVIGQKGGGPGEFTGPGDLAYDKERNVLWVGERGPMRISRFIRNGNSFEFKDAIPARAFMIDRFPSLVLDEEDQYWTNGWYLGSENDSKTLIQLTQSDGTIVKSFGQIWEPEWANTGLVPRMNEGNLLKISNDCLAFIWLFKPTIEIWGTDGSKVLEKHFDTAAVRRPGPGPVENEEGREVFKPFFQSSFYDQNSDILYVGFYEDDSDNYDFYGLDSNTLEIIEWYQLPIGEKGESRLMPTRLVVEMINDSIRFFCLDMINSGVLVLEPR
ncbi:MAG: 6-bladed beta-propeller [Candidatus Thorarchaeota archaeon]